MSSIKLYILIILISFYGCNKQKISERKLLGNKYQIKDFAWYQNTSYEIWSTKPLTDPGDGGVEIHDVKGDFEFGKDGEFKAEFSFVILYQDLDKDSNIVFSIDTVDYIDYGDVKEFNSNRQAYFYVENGPTEYRQYSIYRRNNKEMWLFYNTNRQGGFTSDLLFFKLLVD